MKQTIQTTPPPTINDPRWQAVMTRDAGADGQFYYGVKTTGVYCRPSCGARLPRPENVGFYATRQQAEAAGFRPCKRCKPEQPPLAKQHATLIGDLCRYIDTAIDTAPAIPSLEQLAARAGLSAYHLHRIFKSVTGVTPKAYATAQQANAVRAGLTEKTSVTDTMYDAGYSSSSRFYEKAQYILGMTPNRYRKGGLDTDIRFAIGQCDLGSILVASSDKGVCAILLGDDPQALLNDLQRRFPRSNLMGGDSGFEQLVAQVVGLVEAPQLGLDLPLDIRGTVFQQRVWQALRQIPPGATMSYAEVAAAIGMPKAVRAVAQACGANPLAVAIPCHRVVRTDGGLSGYRWGVARKRALLAREAGKENAK